MKKHPIYPVLIAILFTACKSMQVAVPTALGDHAARYHVKGTSLSVFGHAIKIEGFGKARLHSGFTSSHTTDQRWLPLYYDLDSRMRYVSNHFSNSIYASRTKYRFDFESNDLYVNTYCVGRSRESAVSIRPLNLKLGLEETYSFEGLIFTNKDSTPWKLRFDGNRSLQDGLGSLIKNIYQTDGLLTHDTDTMEVKLVNIRNSKQDGTTRRMPFKIPAGYEFRLQGQLLAFVDLLGHNIWISNRADAYTHSILVSAATSILVNTNAS